jgi:ribosomal protein S18 acetylase RimI-like enzyme
MNFEHHYIPTRKQHHHHHQQQQQQQYPSTVHHHHHHDDDDDDDDDEGRLENFYQDDWQPPAGSKPFQNSKPNHSRSYYTDPSSSRASGAAAAVHDKSDAPTTALWVKGNMVGFVEIVYSPYSLGDLDGPDMLNAGMKPYRPVLRNLVVDENARNSGIGSRLLEACERHVQIHWQMKELVVEVDDLWGGDNNHHQGSHHSLKQEQDQNMSCHDTPRQTSAVEFFRKKGYDVVLSDPESNRYDEETGEVMGQIQCRRDVMRKSLTGHDETTVSSHTPNQAANASPPNDTSTSKSVPPTEEWFRTAVDVEYTPTEIDSHGASSLRSKSSTREDINDPTLTTAELITDLNDGPRRRRQTSRQTVVACDPEGPNQSIFKSNMPNKRQI